MTGREEGSVGLRGITGVRDGDREGTKEGGKTRHTVACDDNLIKASHQLTHQCVVRVRVSSRTNV